MAEAANPDHVPGWLTDILSASPDARSACGHLLFHGTLERFQGRLTSSSWEHVRWAADDPCVAQSYCPATGLKTGWAPPLAYELDGYLLPNGPINAAIFRELGFDAVDLDAKRDHLGHIVSYRVLPQHPTWRQAAAFLRDRGYASETFCWVKTSRDDPSCIMPADHKEAGRLFIIERPADLRIFDYADRAPGGLSGRQWTETDKFRALANQARFDAIRISDVHQSEQLGHFEHASYGIFDHALRKLRYHVIDAVHFDPWDCWSRGDRSTTPEFDALWASCRTLQIAA